MKFTNFLLGIVMVQGIVHEERLHSEKDAAPFNWLKQWYPLAVEADLDPDAPHAQMLMGAQGTTHSPFPSVKGFHRKLRCPCVVMLRSWRLVS